GTYKFTDQLSMILGYRYTEETKSLRGAVQPATPAALDNPSGSVTFTNGSPRVALHYKASENLSLYASYNKGFKSGFLDPTRPTAPTAAAWPSIVLRPERLEAFEIGAKGNLTDNFRYSLAAFYYKQYDTQLNSAVRLPGATQFISAV